MERATLVVTHTGHPMGGLGFDPKRDWVCATTSCCSGDDMTEDDRTIGARHDRAVIVAVDDKVGDLATLEHELRKRYAGDYDVCCDSSPGRALGRLRECRDGGRPVALVLASHWMTDMVGTELLRPSVARPGPRRSSATSWASPAG